MTPLDMAHAAMTEAQGDEAAERGFYARLADAELFLLLTAAPEGEAISPQIFDVEEGRFVLAFDTAERLSGFAGEAAFAALSGRALAAMLAGQGLGVGLNLDIAPSSMLIPAGAVDWLAERTAEAPQEAEARLSEILPPGGLPESLLRALDAKLATAGGLAGAAYLAAVRYENGAEGHLIAFTDTLPGAEPALARTVSEALAFSGLEAGVLDVAFPGAGDPMALALASTGLRFDLPQPEQAERPAPGSDPAKPPILR